MCGNFTSAHKWYSKKKERSSDDSSCDEKHWENQQHTLHSAVGKSLLIQRVEEIRWKIWIFSKNVKLNHHFVEYMNELDGPKWTHFHDLFLLRKLQRMNHHISITMSTFSSETQFIVRNSKPQLTSYAFEKNIFLNINERIRFQSWWKNIWHKQISFVHKMMARQSNLFIDFAIVKKWKNLLNEIVCDSETSWKWLC